MTVSPSTDQHADTSRTETARADRRAIETSMPPDSEAAIAAVAGLAILSTLPFSKINFWNDNVETIPEIAPTRPLSDRLRHLLRLLIRAGKADVVLLNGGERIDLAYLAVAGLCPWIRAPHQIVDAHWHARPGLPGLARRLVFLLGRRLLDEVQPHSPEEIELYHRAFGIPRERIRPLPWSTSLTGYDIRRRHAHPPTVVSGGHSYRDYAVLFEAVRRGGWPLEVGLPPSPISAETQALAEGIANVRIVSDWRIEEYWQRVADSHAFAMPIVPGLTRCTADQTILNAMSFGCVVVATDAISSRLYIRHGENGFLVPEGSPEAWVDTLRRVFALDPEQHAAIGRRAAADVDANYRESTRLARTLLRAAGACARRSGAR